MITRAGNRPGGSADPGHPHAPGGRQAGCAGPARHLALSHGRQRPLCGGLSDGSASHPVSRLAEPRPRPTRGSRRRCPTCKHIQNTSSFWGVRIILRELYGWTEPIDERNWKKLDGLIRERADDRAWPREVLDRARIERTGTELARRGGGEDDDRLQYALEWGFFTRASGANIDTALYELERCWGKSPESPAPIGGGARPATERTIRTLDDVHAADRALCRAASLTAGSCRRRRIFRPTSTTARSRMTRWPRRSARRDQAGPAERDCYASYVNEAFLTALEAHAGRDRLSVQLRRRALAVRDGQPAVATDDRPGRRDDRPASPGCGSSVSWPAGTPTSRCARLVRELPNFSLAGYWWHNFFPDTIAQVMRERLEMVPANKQVGFFSDAYCVEWSFAKAVLVRKILARVLAERIELGQFDAPRALEFARCDLVSRVRNRCWG